MTTTAPAPTRRWTEAEAKGALWRHFRSRGWAVLTEVTLDDAGDERRIDILCLRRARRQGIGHIQMVAIEVKVNPADFRQDVRCPEKQAPWRALAHTHAYAVPAGMVSPEEVPAGSILITLDHDTPGWDKATVPTIRPEVKVPFIPARLIARWAHQLSDFEGTRQGFNFGTVDERDAETLRADLARAKNERDQALDAQRRAEARVKGWRDYALQFEGVPCSTCGHELAPIRIGSDSYIRHWKHLDKVAGADCDLRREAEALHERFERDQRQIRPEDHETWFPDRWFTVPGPYPAEDDHEDATERPFR